MKRRYFSYLIAAALFALLVWRSDGARAGALRGVTLWGELLLPALLPYFAAAGLLTRLGLTAALGRRMRGVTERLFGTGGAGAAVFLLGLSGGYPLGAASAAEEVRAGNLSPQEAGQLLRFCDNSGPAFAVGALGAAVFESAGWGLLLWAVHALSAALLGVALRPKTPVGARGAVPAARPVPFAPALTGAVGAAVSSLLSIGGFVVFFSALLGAAESLGFPEIPAVRLAALTGLDAEVFRALLTGMLELSSGVGAMRGLGLSPANLALGAFLLGWGGVCVHLQAAAVTEGTGISLGRRLRGKLLHGMLAALLTWVAARIALA